MKYYTTKRREKKLKKLIKDIVNPNKDYKTLFIWPEGVFADTVLMILMNLKLIKDNFDKKSPYNFWGKQIDPRQQGYFNSLVVVNSKFEIRHKYNKRKLVPFGEFLPLESMLSKFGLKKITEGLGFFLKE